MPHFNGLCRKCQDRELQHFLPITPQFGERTTFSRQKALQSLDCGALQDGAMQRTRWEKSAAHGAMFSSATAVRLLHYF